jgi:glycosyltransferase involved in cell wall biosynthesis
MSAISVCLLAHNNGRYIGSAIDSVLAQSFEDWEMLISDDASSDETLEIIRRYQSDRRIRYIRHRNNLKQGANWAFAISHTNSPLISTLHADDVWEKHALKSYYLAFTETENVDLVWGNWLRTSETLQPMVHQPPPNPDNTYTGHNALRYLFKTFSILPSAAAFRRRVATDAGLPNCRYGMLCDREWFLRVAKISRSARSLSVRLVSYRVHQTSVTTEFQTSGRLLDELDDFGQYIPELLSVLEDKDSLIVCYNRKISELYLRTAVSFRIAGRNSEAKNRMAQAIALNSGKMLRPRLLLKWLMFYGGSIGTWILALTHGKYRHVKRVHQPRHRVVNVQNGITRRQGSFWKAFSLLKGGRK